MIIFSNKEFNLFSFLNYSIDSHLILITNFYLNFYYLFFWT